MKIGMVGSLKFIDEFKATYNALIAEGHEVYVLKEIEAILKDEADVEEYKSKVQEHYLLDFWKLIQDADALIVLNYDKQGTKNYVGGSTLIGMSFAHVLGQTIYMMNPLPMTQSYFDEILHMKPVVLNGDLSAIPKAK
jgi:hypothetical protein